MLVFGFFSDDGSDLGFLCCLGVDMGLSANTRLNTLDDFGYGLAWGQWNRFGGINCQGNGPKAVVIRPLWVVEDTLVSFR